MSENNMPAFTPGLFGWNELITSDIEAAKKFYGAVFGWTSETKAVAPGWDYTLFKSGETMVGGMIGITPEMSTTQPQWVSYVLSGDVAADVAKARAAGAVILRDVMEIPNTGTMAVIQDPQGAVFALWKCRSTDQCLKCR
jgi:predicted enzyme related to lactoylglutathione lyase